MGLVSSRPLITRVVNPALARNLDSGHRAPLRLTPAATFVMARWRGSPNPGSAHSGIPDSRGSEFSIPTRLTERLAVLWDWIGRSIDPLFLTPEKVRPGGPRARSLRRIRVGRCSHHGHRVTTVAPVGSGSSRAYIAQDALSRHYAYKRASVPSHHPVRMCRLAFLD